MMIKKIEKTREYLDYIEEHYNNVQKAWEELKLKCKSMRFIYDNFYYSALDQAVGHHDLSKLSEREFASYRKKFFPTNNEKKFGEAIDSLFDDAWDHHKKHNDHHWQTWTTKEYHNPNEWEVHCVHMVIDWMAMGYKFNDTAQTYYEKNRNSIELPDYAVKFIYEIFKKTK